MKEVNLDKFKKIYYNLTEVKMIEELHLVKWEDETYYINVSQICQIALDKNLKLSISLANGIEHRNIKEFKSIEKAQGFIMNNFMKKPSVQNVSPFEIKPKGKLFSLYESGKLIATLETEDECKIAQKRIEIHRLK